MVHPFGLDKDHHFKDPHPQKEKKKRRWNKNLVARVLQGFAKIIAAKKLVKRMRSELKLAGGMKRKKRVSTYTNVRAATMIQSLVRSAMARTRLTLMIRSGAIINKAWRGYTAFKRLRADLRRGDCIRICSEEDFEKNTGVYNAEYENSIYRLSRASKTTSYNASSMSYRLSATCPIEYKKGILSEEEYIFLHKACIFS